MSLANREPLSSAERADLLRLRRQVAEQDKYLEFLGKAAAYFASERMASNGSRREDPQLPLGLARHVWLAEVCPRLARRHQYEHRDDSHGNAGHRWLPVMNSV